MGTGGVDAEGPCELPELGIARTFWVMIFGAHIFLWTERWTEAGLPLLERCASLGLNGVEVAVGDDVCIEAGPLRKRAESLKMEVVLSPGGDWPMEADISDDEGCNRVFGLNWHRRWIDVAGEVGAVAYSGALYGHPGRVRRRRAPSDEFSRTAENLHDLAEHAARANVKLVLEPMSHFRTHLVNTPEQALRLVDLADHGNLWILLDTYHLITEIRDFAAAVRLTASRLWGVHACENDRGAPGGGLVPWGRLMAALQASAPGARVYFESYNSSLPGFAEGRGMFHDVCPDGDAFVRAGLRFLRETLRSTGPGGAQHMQPPSY